MSSPSVVCTPVRARAAACLVAAFAGCLVLLAAATLARLDETRENRWKRLTRRYWEDTYLAIGHHLTGRFPAAYPAVRGYKGPEGRGFEEVRPTLSEAAEELHIRPWQFWRTVPSDRFMRPHPVPIFPRYDDSGRPLLLSLGFRLLGGVSPYLLFWLGLLAAVPVLAWATWEMHRAGAKLAAGAFLLLVGLWPFAADVLASPYSALGFYLVALFALVALATYACLGDRVSSRGLLVRGVSAGLVFGLASVCRASCLTLAPGFLLALVIGAWRRPSVEAGAPATGARSRASMALVAAGLAVVLVVPYVAFARGIDALIQRTLSARKKAVEVPPQVHPFWHGVWMGLGDFDRTKGYVWNDDAAFAAIVEAGGTPSTTTYYDPRNEDLTRDLILRDIVEDPGWFLSILTRRVVGTVSQWKLWPWPPTSGLSLRPKTSPNEGHIDAYYTLATPADRFGVGARRVELPVPLILAPTVVLMFLFALGRGKRDGAHIGRRVLVLACLAAALLPHPVLLTTASALETEAFALTYLLGTAFCLEVLVRARRLRAATNSS